MSLGVAPDKDLATPIPMEQQHGQQCLVPASNADLCNPALTKEKRRGVEAATHKVFRYHKKDSKTAQKFRLSISLHLASPA